MKVAVVGHTGLVGSTLARAVETPWLFNSKNVEELKEQTFDLVLTAGVSSLKWWANKNPEEDRARIVRLWDALGTVRAGKVVHISTVDVLPKGGRTDEDAVTDASQLQTYGANRLWLEEQLRARFEKLLIVRCPHLFGRGLKKNFLYDLIHDNALQLVDHRDQFCFYDLEWLWEDVSHFSLAGVPLVHLSCEPLTAAEIARSCFDREFTNACDRAPISYDLRTKLVWKASGTRGYMYERDAIVASIRRFRTST